LADGAVVRGLAFASFLEELGPFLENGRRSNGHIEIEEQVMVIGAICNTFFVLYLLVFPENG
jgi:hypothetical protein